MPRYKLTIEYDGTAFHGWQRQAGLPTVQEEVEQAIEKLSGQHAHVQCSGRTDAGVHAYGQVAHVDLTQSYPCFALRNALNFFLRHKKVVIKNVEEVDASFNARFSSQSRHYLYKIFNCETPSALEEYRAWHIIKPLDIEAMRQGARYLIGTHDFTTFRASACQSHSPIKTLDKIDIEKSGEFIYLSFKSRSFLHNQVRIMVGTLKLVGAGKWTPQHVKEALEAKDRKAGGPTAPPYGLYFVGVTYDKTLNNTKEEE